MAVTYNKDVLRWARERRGISVAEAAAKLKKQPSDIENWERGVGAPTVNQARELAKFYGRPFLEFFLPEPPAVPTPRTVPDFRMHAGVLPPIQDAQVVEIQQWVAAQRTNALDLFQEIGERPKDIPTNPSYTLSADPEAAASIARSAVAFSIQDQINLPEREQYRLPDVLRRKLENFGILTLKLGRLRDFDIRGICIAERPLPVIVIGNEAPSAQAFTLAHEVAHVLIGESGITGFRNPNYNQQPVERWCDRFAGSFLMPRAQIALFLGESPTAPAAEIADAVLERLASTFRVSAHAMLIRLVHLGYVQAAYYWDVKKAQFDEQDKKKRFGRTKYYGSRFRASYGDLYTGLVIEAWTSGRITNHNAAEYMGIKNLAHLNDIRNAVLAR
jgi:Zn-dependent peptidase ImmA (M78 family)